MFEARTLYRAEVVAYTTFHTLSETLKSCSSFIVQDDTCYLASSESVSTLAGETQQETNESLREEARGTKKERTKERNNVPSR